MLSNESDALYAGLMPTARERAHAAVRRDVLDAAVAQLAETGAAGLSLRAVARDVGMVSSAVYRYFASRDELLTALIVEAYDDLGERVEVAVGRSRRRTPLNRWIDAATTIRDWGHEKPNQYALLYGTPVPGYHAPPLTSESGVRPSVALLGIVVDAHRAGRLDEPMAVELPSSLAAQLDPLRDAIGAPDLPAPVLMAAIVAWSQLFGLLSLELFGQTRGLVDDHEALFVATVAASGRNIGL